MKELSQLCKMADEGISLTNEQKVRLLELSCKFFYRLMPAGWRVINSMLGLK